MLAQHEIVIVSGARTPTGRFLGGLARQSATQLGAVAARAALERGGVSPAQIDQVVVGNVIQSSKDAAYIARHIGLDAGVPESVPALTMNRACASGMEAAIQGARLLMLGEATAVLAGGAENMSMTPYAMRGVRTGWRMIKSEVDDMLFSALHDPKAGCSIGETVEHLAAEAGITREEADAWAVACQARAAEARARGLYAQEITPVTTGGRRPRTVEVDETLRPETTAEALAGLPGLFGPDGINTAGNSTGLNDAGCMLVLTTGEQARAEGWPILGRLIGWGAVGVAPRLMGLGPVEASRQALDRAGLTVADLDLIELNDSFAVQAIAVCRALELDTDKVNINGGALALGHPMGATGARLMLTALMALERRGGGRGLCTVCVGGGQGVAVVVES